MINDDYFASPNRTPRLPKRSSRRPLGWSATVVAAAALGCVVSAQVTLTPRRMPFMSANQLVEAAGSDSEAATIVMAALTSNVWALKKTTKLIGSQIPEHWLERAPDVPFTRLSDEEARADLERCGQLLYVERFSRPADDTAVVLTGVVSDAGCTRIGSNYYFDRTVDGWAASFFWDRGWVWDIDGPLLLHGAMSHE